MEAASAVNGSTGAATPTTTKAYRLLAWQQPHRVPGRAVICPHG